MCTFLGPGDHKFNFQHCHDCILVWGGRSKGGKQPFPFHLETGEFFFKQCRESLGWVISPKKGSGKTSTRVCYWDEPGIAWYLKANHFFLTDASVVKRDPVGFFHGNDLGNVIQLGITLLFISICSMDVAGSRIFLYPDWIENMKITLRIQSLLCFNIRPTKRIHPPDGFKIPSGKVRNLFFNPAI